MAIYGTALLSLCLLVGLATGRLLGAALGIDADVGGVGIAMLLLVLASDRLRACGRLPAATESGVVFWGSIYVPVVVAMAASQNVLGALSGGVMALLAGLVSVAAGFAAVALLARSGRKGGAA